MKQSRSASVRNNIVTPEKVALTVYLFTVVAFALAAMVPTARVWGFNWWGYFPLWGTAAWLAMAIVLALFSTRLGARLTPDLPANEFEAAYSYWLIGGLFALLSGTLYYLLPATTHFTGDGYQLLSRLSRGESIGKDWDIGLTASIEWLHTLLGGRGDAGATESYRLYALSSGLIAVGGTLLLVAKLPISRTVRILLLGLILTGGFVLQFFGHVENYALLVALTLIYSLAGYLVALRLLSIWWLVPLLMLLVILHYIAMALIPSFLLLVVQKQPWYVQSVTWARTRWRILLPIAAVAAVACYYIVQQHFLFLQFALLPVIPDRFAIAGEWLFSVKHLLDCINLVLLLSPAVLHLLAYPWAAGKSAGERFASHFLLALVAGTIGIVFLMRSGIGMPRDWDLFSIAGPPLVVATAHALYHWGSGKKWLPQVLCLAISLNCLTLVPRVVVNVTDELAAQHFRAYLDLDFIRGRNARRLLVDFYRGKGQLAAAQKEQLRAEGDYPESRLAQEAASQLLNGQYETAAATFWRVIEMNPLYSDAWANLGATYMNLGKLDSATQLLMIGNHLNPNNLQTTNNLGVVAEQQQRMEDAERWYTRALEIDSSFWRANGNLAYIRVLQGNLPDAIRLLKRAGRAADVPGEYFRMMGDTLAEHGASGASLEVYRLALDKGLDSASAATLMARFPELRRSHP